MHRAKKAKRFIIIFVRITPGEDGVLRLDCDPVVCYLLLHYFHAVSGKDEKTVVTYIKLFQSAVAFEPDREKTGSSSVIASRAKITSANGQASLLSSSLVLRLP